MTKQSFKIELSEYYQGEIVGEIFFDSMLGVATDPETLYKVGSMLQLETEAKAWLRPLVVQAGGDIAETAEARATGLAFADSVKGKSWREAMAIIRDGGEPYLLRYREIANSAPAEFKQTADAMVVHEQALHDFFKAEAANETGDFLQRIVAQLKYPLPMP